MATCRFISPFEIKIQASLKSMNKMREPPSIQGYNKTCKLRIYQLTINQPSLMISEATDEADDSRGGRGWRCTRYDP